MRAFTSINPFDQQVIAEYPILNDRQIDEALSKAEKAFTFWKKSTFSQRKELLKKVAKNLRNNKEEYGKMISLEMGKIISESIAEIEKCALTCDYYADNAEQML